MDFKSNNLSESRKFLALDSAPDIVTWSQKEKCGLKYVIYILGGAVWA
jgi:hypothetical protein